MRIMPRGIRMLLLTGIVSGAIAAVPASASADTMVSPSSVDFGSVPVGTQSAEQVITLTESCGALDLNCLNGLVPEQFAPVLSVTPGFTQTSGCPATLITSLLGLPTSCTIDIRFLPTVFGPASGQLRTGNGPGDPTVALAGSGSTGSSAPVASHTHKGPKCRHAKHHRMFSTKKCKRRR
jgi:hypothetical protein